MLRDGSLLRKVNGNSKVNDNDNGKVNDNDNGKVKVKVKVKVNGKVKVNNRTPRSRHNQLRKNHTLSDQLRINRNGQYTVAFFNRSTLFAPPYPSFLQAHT